ncbi:RecQ family ATP-dependent DNA helicase [Nesterenkonia halophila]|uniref:RecQ family ATP-dependent DNA helicase n=1 Tax=Nesterenkonia halophila TaxID=302044 RepID=UPI00129189E8|nr:DEAD/DEAH box helicase [Nesterenkonia halophila]
MTSAETAGAAGTTSPAPAVSASFRAEAQERLAALTGGVTTFRDGQLEAISALVEQRRRVLVVQRTGWGKSAVYFLAAHLLRARGRGVSLIVSPLIALMRDQIAAAERAGVRARAVNSANAHAWDEVLAELAADELDVLLISPERLANPRFRDEVLPGLLSRLGMLVVDEAHCISDWGHDFRPDYRRIGEIVHALPDEVPVLATTATANGRVVEDVAAQLAPGGASGGSSGAGGSGESSDDADVMILRGQLSRASLRLGVLTLPDAAARIAWLSQHLGAMTGSGIVYTLTVSQAEDLAAHLREQGHQVLAYTGRTDADERAELERKLKDNEVTALIATSALGMGFDKPDLGFVIHLGAPSSPVSYYQQIGRAGRAVDTADVLLLPGAEDVRIWEHFAQASMPTQDRADAVLSALSTEETMSVARLEAMVEIRRSPLELLLKVLEVDGAAARVRGGWLSTGQGWTYDAERYDRILALRRAEQQAMLDYEALPAGPGRQDSCRMMALAKALDDVDAEPCGRCDACAGPWYPTTVDQGSVGQAKASLDAVGVEVPARKQWPTGLDALGVDLKGKLSPDQTAEDGRVLARLSDLGWGTAVRQALSGDDGPISRELVQAAVRVLADWDWPKRPEAVVAVPSRSRPQLVESLASGLAEIGRLPYAGTLELVGSGPTSTPESNSAFRVSGLLGSFAVPDHLAERLPGHSVLLVDDEIVSRWTQTLAARELRRAGAESVLPFALGLRG